MRPINGARLAQQLQLRALTHRQLAEKAGVSQAAITNAINGRPVRPSTVAAIAKALVEVAPVPGAELIAGDAA